MKENLGNNIKRLRTEKGVSQGKMAKDLFMTQSNISLVESGKILMPIPTLISVAEYFEVSLDELILEK